MKRNTFIGWTLAVTATLGLWSCSEQDNSGPDPESVSAAVQEAFAARYPGAANVTWSLRGEYAVASFTPAAATYAPAWGGSSNAWFENRNGAWNMTETDIDFASLPAAVREGFEASKYGDEALWSLTGDVDRLERRDVMLPTAEGSAVVVYVLEVRSAVSGGTVTTVELYFSPEGILVGEVADAEDDDYEGQLPQQPAAGISEWLQRHIVEKGGRVLEIDAEAGGTEVEAVLEGRKLELWFDKAQAWVYTRTDYYRRDLTGAIPSEILAALRSSEHYTTDEAIDEIEKVETNAANGSRTWWKFELETRWDEVDVYVDQSGLLAGRPELDPGQGGSEPSLDEVAAFIAQQYPGARIVGRDYDDGLLEVEILHENILKELLFNGRREWLRTEWELPASQLPAAVMAGIAAGGYVLDDDEADFVQSPSQSCYEVEVRKDYIEYKLRIDPQGTILEAVRD